MIAAPTLAAMEVQINDSSALVQPTTRVIAEPRIRSKEPPIRAVIGP
jgi:hypothetical protein